ncbi:Kinesin-like protein kip2 [Diaporthe australafricana]|uniref:Kinesin-like protein n=1 Tax=Diaporthe australafricana TaxID=127596 RepID=A0ABR3WGE8_9PEZI
MTTALPKPQRNPNAPPNMALPALPVAKTRKSSGLQPPSTPARSLMTTPKSGLRAPSTQLPPPTTPAPTTALPQPRSVSAAIQGTKALRKTVSINSFPQPPRGDTRMSSLPPSPLSSNRRSKTVTSTTSNSNGTPSLLNGSGEGKSVTRASARFSDGLISVSSPPQSRSSSAQDSYSTSATTYDDPVDAAGAKSGADASSKHLSKGDSKGNVVVSVRVRPDAGAQDHRPDGEWMVDGRKSLIGYQGKEGGDYYYDNVFTTHDDNYRVYDHLAKRLVRRVMEGYHGTVFAYGMTGTGKTFSMQGTASSPGVIPLAITDIFSYIRETPSREFLLRVSYLEIYNEKIHDLLSMSTSTNGNIGGPAAQEEIKLREDSKRGVYASPLKEEIVQSPTQLLRVIARGDQARRTASTQFNSRSSRSHAVVQIVVESRERIPGGPTAQADSKRSALLPGGVRVSTLSLIDLAGSEKAAESKERRQEGSHINKSLLTLGTVVSKLSEHKDGKSDKDGKHLPYRDSKLTRLLQGALSGNSLVSILCTIQIGSTGSAAAANSHTNETLNTLKFASRAKNNLVSHAKRAEEAMGAGGEGGARVLLERYRMEITELKSQLEAQAKKDKSEDNSEKVKDAKEELAREKEAEARHEEQMLEMQLARTALKERIDHLNRLILSSKSIGVNASGTWSSLGSHPRFSQASMRSSRSSMTPSQAGRPMLERSASLTSSSSTIGRRPSMDHRTSTSGRSAGDEDDSVGEFGDGTASLSAQNRALQADLVDKNRYIATLEKRLLQARRASSSRTSGGLSSGSKGIMVGEDHSVSTALKERDAEIAELRAQLEDKDRMLIALRSAARRGEIADRSIETRASQLMTLENGPRSNPTSPTSPQRPLFRHSSVRSSPKDRRSVDEMSRILDEMIQDRVETGHIVKSTRGSVRVVASTDREKPLVDRLEPLRQSSESSHRPSVVLEV